MLEEAKVWVKMKLNFLQQPRVLMVQGTFSILHMLQFTEQTRTCSANRSAQEPADMLSPFRHPSGVLAAIKTGSSAPQDQGAGYQNSFIMTHILIRTEKLGFIG